MEKKEFELDYQNRKLKVEFSNLTEQANSSCLVSYGETVALVTLVTADEVKNTDFVPLTVEYEEKYYAAGKIYGSRFVRRESRPTETAILTGRLIDRIIRPLIDQNYRKSIQIVITVSVSYTHLRAHETVLDLVCRLLLEKKNQFHTTNVYR